NIPWMIKNSPIHSGNTHLVAIVAHAIDDAASNASWGQDTQWQFLRRGIEWSEAKHIGTGNRLSRNSQYIAYDPAHTCIGTTTRLNRRRMIMRLDLESNVILLSKTYDTSIITNG